MASSNLVAVAWIALAVALAGLAYWLRRGTRAGHAGWRVIAKLPVEPRRSLLLVAVGDRRLLMSSGEQGLSLLTELSAQDAARVEATAEVELDERAGIVDTLLGAVAKR